MADDTIKILLIEDEEAHMEAVKRAFQPHAGTMYLTCARTMREAMRLLDESIPHLVITDWLLPDGKGMDILSRDKDRAQFPVILMTSHGNEQIAVDAMKAGILDYVMKSPSAFADLPRIAERALREWEVLAENKRIQEALQHSKAYLAATQSLSHTGTWAWDPINSKFVYASEELFRIMGFDPQQGIPTADKVLERIHREDLDKIKKARTLPEKVDFAYEATIVLPDGTMKHLDALVHPVLNRDGDLVEVIGCLADITDRKRAEVALRVSEERFRAVFEGARDMILIKDHSLRFTHVNHTGERTLGLPASEIIGRTAEDLFDKEAASYIKDVDERVLQGQVVEGEYVRKVRGDPITFSEVKVPLRNDAGAIIGICGIFRDITDRKNVSQAWTMPLSDHYPSPAMHKALREARYASATESIVLLQGESGSGKDYLARWIHDQSKRSGGPYFAVNCAAIPKELAESELFGHEAGSFTGASSRKRGLLELAEGGTLLLNEIGELPLSLQSKLLTFLDTKSLLRVGGDKSIHINARLIAATHRNLETEVAEGRFMAPLFYRLNVFTIQVPPLRDRIEDIPVLAEEILLALGTELQLSQTPTIDLAQMNILMRYSWPGNVRELRNVLERALMLACGDRLDIVLPVESQCSDDWEHTIRFTPGRSLQDVTDEVTHSLCEYVLRRSSGSRQETARLLEISRTALYRHMKRLRITNDNETGN
ncbi:MAG: sigma 54-interacting transcriptional regulator [Desulfomonilaceae bacterium]